MSGQKAHHMIGGPARYGGRRHTDHQLFPFGLADGVPIRIGLAKNIEDQRFSIPDRTWSWHDPDAGSLSAGEVLSVLISLQFKRGQATFLESKGS